LRSERLANAANCWPSCSRNPRTISSFPKSCRAAQKSCSRSLASSSSRG
jgi:hypothetical protein